MPIFDTNSLKEKFSDYLQLKLAEVAGSSRSVLNIVLIGDDFASHKYVTMKQKFGTSIGVKTKFWYFEEGFSPSQLRDLLNKFKANQEPTLVQLPVSPSHYTEVTDIPWEIDVDLLGSESQKLWNFNFYPPTIGAVDLILKQIIDPKQESVEQLLNTNLSLKGKVVAVVGQGLLVGRPLLQYLTKAGATIISCNVGTPNIKELTNQADIIITATGVGGLIKSDWVGSKNEKNGVVWPIVIDAGTSEGEVIQTNSSNSEVKKVLVGDVDSADVENKCTLVSVPGGVGPVTVRYIFWNFYRLLNL
ncbi:MAG: bifunctional methylenetetrahydrofolate dehydrogenase/methenyltetrahydrofolate cyclohydrolase FolD [Patescibacteria group bacterium]